MMLSKIKRLLTGTGREEPPAVSESAPQPIEILNDTFITWLGLANAGMLTPGNVWCFDYAITHLPSNNPMIEIGAFCGLSTNVISYFKLVHGRTNKLYCVDPWTFEGSDTDLGHPLFTHKDYRSFVKETFLRNVAFFNGRDLPSAFELGSSDFFSRWSAGQAAYDLFHARDVTLGGPISFAYIDGNHTYAYALQDFQNVDRWLEPGGLILFDDSGDGSGWEVCRVVAEVSAMDRYELIKKNPNYLFRKR
jgi:hypothetical protein